MTTYFMNLLWSLEPRWGIGFDVESTDSRPVWTVENNDLRVMAFNGLVILIPFFIICIGNVYTEED